jgi:hypothetical protein
MSSCKQDLEERVQAHSCSGSRVPLYHIAFMLGGAGRVQYKGFWSENETVLARPRSDPLRCANSPDCRVWPAISRQGLGPAGRHCSWRSHTRYKYQNVTVLFLDEVNMSAEFLWDFMFCTELDCLLLLNILRTILPWFHNIELCKLVSLASCLGLLKLCNRLLRERCTVLSCAGEEFRLGRQPSQEYYRKS